MKTRVIQDEPAPAPLVPPPATPPRSSGAPLVLGIIAVVVALAMLASGVATLAALNRHDSGGFLAGDAHRIATPSNAFATERLDIDRFGGTFATSRIEATSSQPIFVGVGPAAAVERYLAGVRHARITDIDTGPFRVSSHLVPGGDQIAPPAAQGFWRVQASGPGTQRVTWPVESGHWSAVVMNADGSPGVDAVIRLAARVPALRWIGIGLLVVGGLVALAGATALRHASRQRRSS
jgi:hypothetical protein